MCYIFARSSLTDVEALGSQLRVSALSLGLSLPFSLSGVSLHEIKLRATRSNEFRLWSENELEEQRLVGK